MTPKLKFKGDFIVRSDGLQWIVAKEKIRQKGDQEGVPYEEGMGYYPSLSSALNRVLEFQLRESDAKSVEELRSVVEDFRKEVGGIFTVEVPDGE